jgi:hypothetical protein
VPQRRGGLFPGERRKGAGSPVGRALGRLDAKHDIAGFRQAKISRPCVKSFLPVLFDLQHYFEYASGYAETKENGNIISKLGLTWLVRGRADEKSAEFNDQNFSG